MDMVKGLLMGCGVVAILGTVGCVGLMGVGSYAIDQAVTEYEQDLEERRAFAPPNRDSTPASDPFSDYQGDENHDSDWGEGSR